jgi:hypothetical protein
VTVQIIIVGHGSLELILSLIDFKSVSNYKVVFMFRIAVCNTQIMLSFLK